MFSPPSLAPAFSFRFAVDSGIGIFENFTVCPISRCFCVSTVLHCRNTQLRRITIKYHHFKIAAFQKDPIPHHVNVFWNNDDFQAGQTKGSIPDACNTVTNCDARQAGAFAEGRTPNAGNTIRNRDARQAAACIEGSIPDASDTIRNRDARQAVAVFEGTTCDAGNTVRDRDARQAAACIEGPISDAGNTFRNRDARQAAACIEGKTPDAGNAAGDHDAR